MSVVVLYQADLLSFRGCHELLRGRPGAPRSQVCPSADNKQTTAKAQSKRDYTQLSTLLLFSPLSSVCNHALSPSHLLLPFSVR